MQYGLIFKETTIKKFNKYLTDDSFRNEFFGFQINGYSIIEDVINNNREYHGYGLNAPENIEIKREIFSFFGLDADKSYAENLEQEMNRQNKYNLLQRIRKYFITQKT